MIFANRSPAAHCAGYRQRPGIDSVFFSTISCASRIKCVQSRGRHHCRFSRISTSSSGTREFINAHHSGRQGSGKVGATTAAGAGRGIASTRSIHPSAENSIEEATPACQTRRTVPNLAACAAIAGRLAPRFGRLRPPVLSPAS